MLAISSRNINSKLSGNRGMKLISLLFALSLATTLYAAYAIIAWTGQYYDLGLGLLLSIFMFLGILFFNRSSPTRASRLIMNKHVIGLTTIGAAYSYTLFLTHYPIIIMLNGLNLPVNRFLMMLPILLITNLTAFCVAHFTERKHKELAKTIKKWLRMSQC